METTTKSSPYRALATKGPSGYDQYTKIESYRILETKFYPYILTLLTLIWLTAQYPRYKRHLNAGCWYGWDAMGVAVVGVLCQRKKWAAACVFTSAFFVWTRLPGSPLGDHLRLPSFGAFLRNAQKQQGGETSSARKSSRQTEEAEARGDEGDEAGKEDEDEDEATCLVCWSSETPPLQLPCAHLLCADCLTTMSSHRQTCCPLCQHQLYHANTLIPTAIHKLAVSALAARQISNALIHALQLYHGLYWDVLKASITYLPQFHGFWGLYVVTQRKGVEWWQYGLFDYLLPMPWVSETRFARGVWPAVGFAVLFLFNIWGDLRRVAVLELVAQRTTLVW